MMRTADEQKRYEKAIASITRLQTFDTATLPRVQQLGEAINFQDAVEPANRLVDLYRQIPLDVLETLPIEPVEQIGNQANTDFTYLKQVLDFEPGTPRSTRDSFTKQLIVAYGPAWERLNAVISYSVRKSTDFARLEREGRAVVQAVQDEATTVKGEMEMMKVEAQSALDAIRKAAAEQGVSQQAIHFSVESDAHSKEAKMWLKRTVILTIGLAVYAVATLFLHRWPLLAPANAFETVQLSVSKVLVFATLSFILLLAAKNYNAHRHNAVVNKHRQNALATYEALVRAAGEKANADIVLTKASDCIFSPQSTGYSREGSDSGSVSFVSMAPGSVKASAS